MILACGATWIGLTLWGLLVLGIIGLVYSVGSHE